MRKFLLLSLLCMLLLSPLTGSAQDDDPALPVDRAAITPENINQLALLAEVTTPLEGWLSVDWSPNHPLLAATGPSAQEGADQAVVLYDLMALTDVAVFHENAHALSETRFSPDGRYLATSATGTIAIFDLQTGALITEIMSDTMWGPITWSPDGTVIAAMPNLRARHDGASTGIVHVFDARDGTLIGSVGYPYSSEIGYDAVQYAFTADSAHLITMRGPQPHVWEYRRADEYGDPLLLTKDEVLAVFAHRLYTPDDAARYSFAAYRNGAGEYALWLVAEDGSALFSTQTGTVTAITPGMSGIGELNEDGVPDRVEDYTLLARVELFQAFPELETLTFLTPDGDVMLISPFEAAAQVPRWTYDAEADTLVDNATGTIYTAVEDDRVGQFLADDGSRPSGPRFYYTGGDLPETLPLPEGYSYPVISPDYQTAAVFPLYSDESDIVLIDLATGAVQVTLQNAPEHLPPDVRSAFAFDPSGRLLAANYFDTYSPEAMFYVWDVQTGALLLQREMEFDRGVSFSPDGTLLATWGMTLRFYGIAP